MPKINVNGFYVEGNIGAGKSTFLKIIKKYLDVKIVLEPVDKWQNVSGLNLFETVYKNPKRWSYTFQSFVFISRIIHEKQNSLTEATFKLFERSIYTDYYCFARNCLTNGYINSLEYNLYKKLFRWMLFELNVEKPRGFIYLKTSPEICYKRLVKRNRHEETGVALDYLKNLHEKHEDFFLQKKCELFDLKDIPVLILPNDKDFEKDVDLQVKYAEEITKFVENNYKSSTKIGLKENTLL